MVKAVGYIDGVISPIEEVRIPVMDRGFLYGDSIYEVFRSYKGIPFLFDAHYERLLNSARLSMMHISQSKAEIIEAIQQTLDKADIQSGEDIYVRYQITRGEGSVDLYPDPSLKTRLIIIVKPVPQWSPLFYSDGMKVAVTHLQRNSVNSLDPNIKGGNYLNNILALHEARESGADDCVMLDAEGMVTECSNSNIWFVMNNQLVTPEVGNLQGLTRKSLVDLLENIGEQEVERAIHFSELAYASECFVTSATREVMPVKSLLLPDENLVKFPSGGGEKTRQCMMLYQKMLNTFIEKNKSLAWF